MPLDPRYITTVDLEPYFVDKRTGQPLANGVVNFWRDTQRTVPKLVYQLIDAPPYMMVNSYAPLPNPIILSQNGTFQDAAGNNIAVYYFPYDANGNLDLYYITVTDQFGVQQFTREAWPFPSVNESTSGNSTSLENQIKNPQFNFVNFIPPTLTITIPGAQSGVVAIAPEWNLNYTSTGASTITVTRNPIAGNSNLPFNPPYTLTITPGANISVLNLSQLLPNQPGIWSPQPGAPDGWVASSIMLANGSAVTINYVPSAGAMTQLMMVNNTSGVNRQFNATVQLPSSNNPNNGDTGFINIVLILSNTVATTLTNVQILGIEQNETINYTQTTVNIQQSNLFAYYNPLLQFKPIPSYLVGWDFSLNPAQFLTSTVAAFATGANTSNYVWDQTIIFQTANSGFSVARAPNDAMRITSNGSQFALIQYLGPREAHKILYNQACSMLTLRTNVVAGVMGTVSLWYCTDVNLPNMNTNHSLIATLDANGKPSTLNGTWVEIPRNGLGSSVSASSLLGNGTFRCPFSPIPVNIPLNGWFLNDSLGGTINAATFFAIVVGFENVANTFFIDVESISLAPGNIPTIPAPQARDEVIRECQRYYQNSFDPEVLPATGVGLNSGCANYVAGKAGVALNSSTTIALTGPMRTTPTLTFYNPVNANAQAYDTVAAADCSGTLVHNNTTKGFAISTNGNAGTSVGNTLQVHWAAEARLGIV